MKHIFYGDVFIKTLETKSLLDENNNVFMTAKDFINNITKLSNIYIYVSLGEVYYSTTRPIGVESIRLLDF